VAACVRKVEPYAIKLRSQPATDNKAHVLAACIHPSDRGLKIIMHGDEAKATATA
jgi:hypothetical protein